ncbi:MAG: thiamine-phosphate kinase [Rickettsiales bacterium]|nr:thiamine-phosphate kinase [Rickettsiales bacterium]
MNEDYIISHYITELLEENSVNDDVALVTLKKADYIITSDAINENIHFFASDPAKSIAYRLIMVNLSDIFAKGAHPLYLMLNLGFKSGLDKDWYEEFFDEIKHLKSSYNFKIIGGDTTLSTKNSFSATVIAESYSNMPKRSNAKLGDELYITNVIGGSFLGCDAIKQSYMSKFINNYHYPKPTDTCIPLIKQYANGSTDSSDGLYSALENISTASNLGYEIDFLKIPFASNVNLVNQFCLSDDYQVLFSSNPNNSDKIKDFSYKYNLNLSKIGKLTSKSKNILNIDTFDKSKIKKFFHQL